jgi:hypothetical protein
VTELRSDRDAVDPTATAQETKSNTKVQNTALLTAQDRLGMKDRDQIEVALFAKYSRVPDKLAAARSATHIERAPKRAATPAHP